jgi:hypothetical protein
MEVAMRIITALTLSLSLLSAACTGPDGRLDPGATLGLAAGLAAVGGLVYLASRNDDSRQPRRHYGYAGGPYGYRGGHRGYR